MNTVQSVTLSIIKLLLELSYKNRQNSIQAFTKLHLRGPISKKCYFEILNVPTVHITTLCAICKLGLCSLRFGMMWCIKIGEIIMLTNLKSYLIPKAWRYCLFKTSSNTFVPIYNYTKPISATQCFVEYNQ